jgi:hypothetical protein
MRVNAAMSGTNWPSQALGLPEINHVSGANQVMSNMAQSGSGRLTLPSVAPNSAASVAKRPTRGDIAAGDAVRERGATAGFSS